jgi:hypothetical protein
MTRTERRGPSQKSLLGKQLSIPKKLARPGCLFMRSFVIPQPARIPGIDTNEWSAGYYGSLDRKRRLGIESDPLFVDVLARYEATGFEAALDRLKIDLLKCSSACA